MELGTYEIGEYAYEVLAVGRHTETEEEMVVYRWLYESSGKQVLVRPKDFFEVALEPTKESTDIADVVYGMYKHYKNRKNYDLLYDGINPVTLEQVIVYQAKYDDPKFGNNAVWIRPKEMFLGNVEQEGQKVPRFIYLG